MKHKAAPADSSVLINHVNRLGDSLPFIPLESCNSAVNWIWDKAALLQAGFCKVLSRITTYSTSCFVLLLPSTRRWAVKQHSQTPENFPCGSPRLFLFALGVSQDGSSWFLQPHSSWHRAASASSPKAVVPKGPGKVKPLWSNYPRLF